MGLIKRLYLRFRNLILYGIIGSLASGLDFVVFTILSKYIGIYYILANCISVLVGITTSFILNRSFNFKVKDKVGKRFIIFLFVGLCGLGLSNIILYVGVDMLQIGKTSVKFASIILVVLVQFLLNKFITFRVKQ